MPVSHALPAQEIIVVKITPAQLSIPESPISSKISIAEDAGAALPNDCVIDNTPASNSRAATVPTAITRVVTINKLAQLFRLAPAAATSLS